MSDSDEGVLQIDLDRPEQSPENFKRSKLKRSGESLKVNETEEEFKYKNIFKDMNVINDFSNLIKCTNCQHSFKSAILEGKEINSHPILGVLMCEPCCEFYGSGEFSLDEDGEDKYCRWCGEGGKIFLCANCICGFCPKCIKKHFGKKKLKEIERDDDWSCFICKPQILWKLRTVCDLAKKQSLLNKHKNDAVENETPKKKKSPRLRNSKQCKLPENLNHEITNNKGGSSSEDSPSSSKETEGSCAKLCPSKRKRFLASNPRGKATKESCKQSDEEGEPPKKNRSTRSRNRGKMPSGQKRPKYNENEVEFSSSSSDSSDDENENKASALKELSKKGTHPTAESKKKNLNKLKDIFSVAETVSDLCLTMCRKKIRKLDRNLMSDEKVLPECEKLRSMIILMSCSLSTVHNLIISFQQKWKMKENLGVQFHGTQDSTFLEAIGKILRTKRIKTSYFYDIVSDILNRYPFIELGVKNFNKYHCNNVLIESRFEWAENGACHSPKVNFARERDERNDINGIPKTEFYSSAETVIADDLKNPNFNTTENILGKVTRDHAIGVSSQILVHDTNHLSSNDESSEPSSSVRRGDELSTSLHKNNTSDDSSDVEKLYSESLILREQLLLSSSDDSFPNDEMPITGGNSSRVGSLSEMKRKAKRQESVASANQFKEDREISRLTDLSSLERHRRRNCVGLNSGEESDLEDEEAKQVRREINSSKLTVSDVYESSNESKSETPSGNLNLNTNYGGSIEYVLENASLMKSYFLETTSSSDDSSEISSSEKKPKKARSSAKSSSTGGKLDRKKTEKSAWRSDTLLRASVSFSDTKSNNGASQPKERSIKKSNEEANASDSSVRSLNIGSVTKRKRKRVFLSSSTDSDVGLLPQPTVESPTKGRRNIKKIVKTGNLHLETRTAMKVENERKKRVAERKAMYEELFPNMMESDRLVLDFDPDTKDVLLEVPRELVQKLKPHQKEGIKFMWDCCFESLDSLEQSNGSGCVLAHCMGLGKTLQVISLIFTVMKNGIGVKTFLILCPLNVVSNWVDEFNVWLKDLNYDINVSNLNNIKGNKLRCKELREWQSEGGVMIVSYDLMRYLTSVKKMSENSAATTSYSEFLLNPGPDLVICDEGHLLKNQGTALSKCITKMNTSRRIILTGTPLQNNLIEYHSMVQFIKPNILGTKREFMNRFGNPIMNGQFEDSTAKDVKLMRARSHVLHKLLDGCIQRFNYSVLTPYLPEKHEYVLSIRLTESQAKMYQYYVDKCRKSFTSGRAAKLFSDFQLLTRIWTHPRLLASYTEKYEDELSNELDENEANPSSSEESVICLDSVNRSSGSGPNINELLKPEEYEDIQSSGKLVLLFHILSRCRKVGDKVLVFSQSLSSLNLIEYFLHKVHLANESASEDLPAHFRDTWEKGIDYYRMEGSTSHETRTKWCKSFNSEKNKRSRLFLISTRAGGLGINLVGANRVVIFDVSWNPSQDVQSIFRVYRFGQLKACYIYRFVAEGTMEEKIYARQVTKLSLEKRVLDEQQIERHYTMGNLQALYTYDPVPKEKWKVPLIPKDMILAEIINNKNLIASYHEHDSLLENKEEEKLTEEERKAAWEDFERERFMAENQITSFPNTNISNNATGANPITTEGSQMPNARVDNLRVPIFPLQYPHGFYSHINYPHFGVPLGQPYFTPTTHYFYRGQNLN